MTTRAATTSDTLWAALKASASGDTVTLAPGSYGALSVAGFAFADPGVTVNGKGAVFQSLAISGSQGIKFVGIEIAMAPTQQYGAYTVNSSRIAYDQCNVHQADNKTLAGVGFFTRSSTDISITNGSMHHLGVGASSLDCVGVSIVNNDVHDIQTDGLDFAGTSNSLADGNRFRDFYPEPQGHPDAVQFWSTAANPSPAGNIARNNDIRRGAGQVMQGVFVENQSDITITGNAMLGTMYNGIGLSGVAKALIEANFVQAYTDMGSQIITRGQSSDVTVRDNTVSQPVVTLPAEAPYANYVLSGSVQIPAAAIGDTSALDKWLAAKGSPVPPVVVPPVVVPPVPPVPPVTPPVVVDPRDDQIVQLKASVANLKTALNTVGGLALSGRKAKAKNTWLDQITAAVKASLAPQ